jgi:hypothetical protein
MIVLKLEGFLVLLTRSELTHCLQNFIKITNRLHGVPLKRTRYMLGRHSFTHVLINSGFI